MIPVAEAQARILAAIQPLPAEVVSLPSALGRVLAMDVAARLTQPPADVSAMDGWAVRAADIEQLPATLRRIGESPAGRPFTGHVGPGDAVRIFTGGFVPSGADTIVIQEDCEDLGEKVLVREGSGPGRWIRPAGLDFREGCVALRSGRRLTVRDIALCAAMNVPWLTVHRRPRIAIIATGDEVVRPGEPIGPGQIVSSNSIALAALVARCGGEAIDLGIAADKSGDIRKAAAGAAGCDLLVTTGGASVGEHDVVRRALEAGGLSLDFWKIAMRPGKPLMFGRLGTTPMIGLPGNPVSSLVCGILFLRPAIRALQGDTETIVPTQPARLGAPMPVNDKRADYVRATLRPGDDGVPVVTAFPQQDSSMLSRLAEANCLIVRPPFAPAASIGDTVEVLRLDDV